MLIVQYEISHIWVGEVSYLQWI